MTGFEYKVVPAPLRGLKGKGIKGTPARFANALETVMNEMGTLGWEYQRTDTLPVEERQGLTGKTTTFQNLLVFRRPLDRQIDETPEVAALIEDLSEAADEDVEATPESDKTPEPGAMPEAEKAIEHEPALAMPADQPIQNGSDLTEGHKSAISLKREDRVSETLQAPFVFPWNKRRAAPSVSMDDRHFPAE